MGIAARVFNYRRISRESFVRGLFSLRPRLAHLSNRAGALLRKRTPACKPVPAAARQASRTLSALGRSANSLAQCQTLRIRSSADLENPRVRHSPTPQSGFVLVQALALVPLLVTALVVASALQFAIRKKLTAQTLCVRTATELQKELSKTLDQLLKLNPQAKRLRAQREAADQAWKKALASGNPYAIAITTAARTAVILAQTALQAEQQRILLSARARRAEYHQRLQPVKSQVFYFRPLAVEPVPRTSLSPDYVMVPRFEFFQQHQFEFDVKLTPSFWPVPIVQKTLCSISLAGKEKAWKPQVIAASALSKSQLF